MKIILLLFFETIYKKTIRKKNAKANWERDTGKQISGLSAKMSEHTQISHRKKTSSTAVNACGKAGR